MKFKKLKEKMNDQTAPSIRVVGESSKKYDSMSKVPEEYDDYKVEEIEKDMTIILSEKKGKKKKKKSSESDENDISKGIAEVESEVSKMKEEDKK